MAEIISIEEAVLVHYKDGKKVAVTFFNGREERYKLKEPMNRRETTEFYEVDPIQRGI